MTHKIEKLLQEISKNFYATFDDATLLLFGSRANGTATKYSAIDLAIQHNGELDKNKMLQWTNFIDELPTLYSMDIVDMKYANELLQQQIKENSIVLK